MYATRATWSTPGTSMRIMWFSHYIIHARDFFEGTDILGAGKGEEKHIVVTVLTVNR